jgi:diguanylate cyclase (GGDEF)-like protein/PAS domain S-box-containing protein
MPSSAKSARTRPESAVSGIVSHLLEEGRDESFDRLTRLASMALRAPAAVLSLMSDARLAIKSQTGLPEPWASAPHAPLPHAMFRHALATSKPFVADDIRRHPLTKDMALGAGWESAAYCGVPLLLPERRVVGVLSVFDARPRHWSDDEISFLQDLAASAVQEIEGRMPAVPAAAHATTSADADLFEELARGADGFVAFDAEWRFVHVNARAERLLRREAAEVIGASLLTVMPDLMGTLFHQELVRAYSEGVAVEFEERCASLDLWLEVRAHPVHDGLAVHFRDVTARRTAEDALRTSEARYRSVFQESKDPIVFAAADGTLLECNRATIDLFGYAREELFRLRLDDLFVDEAELLHFRSEMEQSGEALDLEAKLRTKDGTRLDCMINASVRRGPTGIVIGFQAILRDHTLQRRAEEQLLHNAFHDALTGLPNRALFLDRLERVLVHSNRRPGYRFAVLFVDLDRFKLINDTMGHLAGDELLVGVARRLERCLRQEDTVARFGGDEFALLLDGVQDVRDATRVAERINYELALPFRVGRREVAASASIGIALSASGYEHPDDVLHDADAAMYRAKASGRARYEVYDTDMHSRALAQLQLEVDLRVAVERHEIVVFYQPIVSLDEGIVLGLEALVRWQHPSRGLLLPAEFLPLAEQTGASVDVGWLVLRDACHRIREWGDQYVYGGFDLTVSVNLSARQFLQPDLLTRLDDILAESGADPVRLRLEVTEGVLMQNTDLSTSLLAKLAQRGIRVLVDDFGTAATSLAFLQRLPIAGLKIDRSFVTSMDRDPFSLGLVQTSVMLAQSLSIEAIAEGIETLEQLQELRALGAKYGQGSLFSDPLDPVAAGDLVLDRVRE